MLFPRVHQQPYSLTTWYQGRGRVLGSKYVILSLLFRWYKSNPITQFSALEYHITPWVMDAWHRPEVWYTRDETSFSLNWARFVINALASGLILLQTIHILWISAREAGKPFSVPFNYTFPVLLLLVTQHAALACVPWFTATPMPEKNYVSIMNPRIGWIA